VSKVYALEPNPGMIRLATQQRRRTKLDIEFLDLPGERIFLENGSVDTVVSTFALCMVPGVVEVIRGIGRVLRPGGQVHLFSSTGSHPILEYSAGSGGRSPFLTGVRRLPRNTGHSVSDHSGRFKIEEMEMTYPAPFPRLCSYSWWVTAGPQSRLRLFGLVRGQQALVRDRRYLLVTCQLRVVDPAKAL